MGNAGMTEFSGYQPQICSPSNPATCGSRAGHRALKMDFAAKNGKIHRKFHAHWSLLVKTCLERRIEGNSRRYRQCSQSIQNAWLFNHCSLSVISGAFWFLLGQSSQESIKSWAFSFCQERYDTNCPPILVHFSQSSSPLALTPVKLLIGSKVASVFWKKYGNAAHVKYLCVTKSLVIYVRSGCVILMWNRASCSCHGHNPSANVSPLTISHCISGQCQLMRTLTTLKSWPDSHQLMSLPWEP